MAEAVFLYTTWPDAETAQVAGAEAVNQGLAACANIGSPMVSIYRWKGAVERASETPMILKTSEARAPALRDFITGRHPYETPCIVALPIAAAGSSATFLDWIAAETA